MNPVKIADPRWAEKKGRVQVAHPPGQVRSRWMPCEEEKTVWMRGALWELAAVVVRSRQKRRERPVATERSPRRHKTRSEGPGTPPL
jgi:hypothetical protein